MQIGCFKYFGEAVIETKTQKPNLVLLRHYFCFVISVSDALTIPVHSFCFYFNAGCNGCCYQFFVLSFLSRGTMTQGASILGMTGPCQHRPQSTCLPFKFDTLLSFSRLNWLLTRKKDMWPTSLTHLKGKAEMEQKKRIKGKGRNNQKPASTLSTITDQLTLPQIL